MVFFEALNREWKQSRRPLSAAFVVVALAWLGAFAFVTWSPDNYMQVFAVDQCRTGWVDLGRPLMDPLYCVLFQGRFQPQLQLGLGVFCLFSVGLLISVRWGLKFSEKFFLIAFISTFPFLCNIFGFETGKFSIPLAYLCATGSWLVSSSSLSRQFLLAPVLLAASLCLYQTSLNFLVVLAALEPIFVVYQSQRSCSLGTILVGNARRVAFLLLSGIPLYLLASGLARVIAKAGYNSRYSWIGGLDSLPGLMAQVRDIGAHYKHYLVPGHPLLPSIFGLTLLLCLAIAIGFSLFNLSFRFAHFSFSSPTFSLAVLICLPAAYLSVWATDLPVAGSLLGDGYRHTYPVAIVFAVTCIIAHRLAVRFRFIRFVVDALSFSSLLAFIITDNSWAFDTYRLSLFDISVGTRLVQQVQMSSSYKSTNPLLIVGSLPSSSRPPALHPKGYDVLGSGLDNSGSAAALLRTLGLKFSLPTEATLVDCKQIVKSATPVAVSSTCSAIDLSKI